MVLSAVLIVKNEEARLRACLGSLAGLVDETVVVDTGSSDATMDVARDLGARLFSEPWQGDFSAARNRSIAEARGEWILWIDADDLVPAHGHAAIRALCAGPRDRAFSFIIENLYDNRPGQVFRQTRLFPARRAICFDGRIHETLSYSLARAGLAVVPADVRIIHTGYNTAAERSAKIERNHALLLRERTRCPNDPAVLMELGNSYFQQGRFAEAVAQYRAIADLPGVERAQPDIFRSIPSLVGNAYLAAGDRCLAQEWFERGVRDFPERMTPRYFLGKIALDNNDADAALAHFLAVTGMTAAVTTVAVDISGMQANAFAYAANILLGRGDHARALALFSEADRRFPVAAFSYGAAAQAALRAGDGAAALSFFRKGEARGDLSAQEYSDYGVLVWETGEQERALGLFERALDKDPGCAVAAENYADAAGAAHQGARASAFIAGLGARIAQGGG
ncbi:MAG: hypothetical protein A2268_14270 [Candidatus Raymondbacteria bacterium RifOxyA12_full_50_37]|uniref:Glycosyltransferase 2-like domain-containing protein n=1 Tax=Candidatus Raymondbacteria bacterium RIFOXYD12_FULL_49_13 TaxID=1817890 RepID=A0A1F7FKV4_UNCRA|nr:MAG: hypothetical protein A2268_14270 [Candidatus Raymondbacteria bacterium RifOxyA12_full_50_37]OGJ86925.1 MAG: hypothetical protein A2350_02180 [Candidatus Raymondbacteria bacterium RifOxyB12_full_50_8]OGJ88245.1 MAG: hypothetical protein A2248_19610 [Candidatus Raymondbacteria bacterium RIFOXYA2_FULL_49_16]OGK07290.1 MAG: hypothetical protein A2519_14280 [Candidatus Raymondbacteria bacterium RIFOXYD12_FULL_49_13]OGP41059.1 MAG: hypothetical protein A2324_06235 [Candidatus Raymondbacteria 